jgi:spore germination protein YaaH
MLTVLLLVGLSSCTAIITSRNTVSCSYSSYPDPSDTCQSFASAWAITVEQLVALNPSIDCTNFDADGRYCVLGTVSPDAMTTSSPKATSSISGTTQLATTTTRSDQTSSTTLKATTMSVAQHQPQQSGLVTDCDKFYQVSSGDSCDSVTHKFGITGSQFVSWNPSIDSGKCLIRAFD